MSSENLEIEQTNDLKKQEEINNIENPIEPQIYKPLNDYEKIKLNKNNTGLEEKSEMKIKELMKFSNENRNSKKEKYIEEKLLEKYSKELKDEIYNEEYRKLYNKIKSDISYKVREELLLRKQKEIEIKKKKFEYNNNKKLEEYKNILYRNMKEEYEMSKMDILNLKINEYEEKYKKEFFNNKDKIKRELIIEFQNMTNKLIEELEESKKDLISQQNKEKMRIKQLNKIKGNYEEKEDYEKQKNEQINTMINNYRHFKMDNRRINVYPTAKVKNNLTSEIKIKEKANNLLSKENNHYFRENKFEENEKKNIFENAQNKNGINIKEINNRLKRKKD